MNIEIHHLSKSFGSKGVLQDLNAILPEGETTIIMGPSGCGKTTLLRILLGLEQADQGTISLPFSRFSVVFQEDRLCEDFSAFINLKIVMSSALSSSEKEERIKKALDAVGLSDVIHAPVHTLSGGMKRRIAILRAILADTPLVLMDEPFRGLDTDTKELVMDYVKENLKGKTFLLITHDAQEARFFGDHKIIL